MWDEKKFWSIWGRRQKSTAESCRGKRWDKNRGWQRQVLSRHAGQAEHAEHYSTAFQDWYKNQESFKRENSHIHLVSHFILHTVGTLQTVSQSLLHFYVKSPSLSFMHSQNGVKPNLTVSSSSQVLESFTKQTVAARQQAALWPGMVHPAGKGLYKQDFAISGKFSAFQNNPFSLNRCLLILLSQFSIGSSLSTALQRLSENKTQQPSLAWNWAAEPD